MTEHERLVRSAYQTGVRLNELFGRLGTSYHPRGRVLMAYRTARRALKGNLNNPGAVNDALVTLETSVRQSVSENMQRAIDLGAAQAERDLKIHELPAPIGGGELIAQAGEFTEVVIGSVDVQVKATRALVAQQTAEENMAIILGDDTRVGLLTPGPVLREASRWLATMVAAAWSIGVIGPIEQEGRMLEFQKQAISAVDGRTTETCLRVHGQIVALDRPFYLEGTPRYADYMEWPPFHWWCRTSAALFRPDFDIGLTDKMEGTAEEELARRLDETGKYGPTERGPAMYKKPKPPDEPTPVLLSD